MRLAALALLLAASPAFAASRPVYGGAARVAVPGPARELDPALAESPQDRLAVSLVHQPPLGRTGAGALEPVLLDRLPESDDGGRTFRLTVREGLTFHDGTTLDARDVAATLRRLGDPALRSPHAALVLPLRGVEARGAQVIVTLAFPSPRWPEVLAEPALGVVPASTRPGTTPRGAGPFRPTGAGDPVLNLGAFEDHASGRPFLDAVALVPLDGPRARRALQGGAVDLALLPSAEEGALWTETVLVLGPTMLPELRAVLQARLDRADLVRWFVPGEATARSSLLPPHLDPGAPAAAPAVTFPGDSRYLSMAFDPEAPGHRAVAGRIQLRLHELGLSIGLEPVAGPELRARAAAGRVNLALVQVPLPRDTSTAVGSLLLAGGREEEALTLLARAGAAGADPGDALVAVRTEVRRLGQVPLLPLWAAGVTLQAGPEGALHLPPHGGLASAWRER